MSLEGKTILVTGAARRIGRHLALTAAAAGADVVLHHAHSDAEVIQVAAEIEKMGRRAWVLQADFAHPEEAQYLIAQAAALSPLYALVNNGAIFEPLSLAQTTLDDWQRTLNINLTAPFLLSREFAAHLPAKAEGRIVNILDWRALRPREDHFAYTISKAALAAMTRSMAVALAPNITVNGLALGAILPPSVGATGNVGGWRSANHSATGSGGAIGSGGGWRSANHSAATEKVLEQVPARRWAALDEVGQAMLFLLDGPSYITGEIIHLDGGRHLV